ncbi:hypothetical protein ACIGNX_01135 [Actinosynnema sp. NPDC053489]|uniref:hypothetical protein n=1 Tax=Actinosynnema sp. NPDC053489 TaxID=3363916 RepID=UPI0037C9EB84
MAATLGLVLITASTAALPAVAEDGTAHGTFYYVDLVGGNQEVRDPAIGDCHLVSTVGTSVYNATDTTVTLYTDTSCAVLANPVPPGSSITFLFKSYRFL